MKVFPPVLHKKERKEFFVINTAESIGNFVFLSSLATD